MRIAIVSVLIATAGTAVADSPTDPDPVVKNDPDKPMIKKHIRQVIPKITYCYERQLLAQPKLAGTVTVKFTIEADGKVSAATGSGLHQTVDACVADVIKGIAFDRPSGGKTDVNYPFLFRSEDDTSVAAPTVTGGGDPDRVMIRRVIQKAIQKLQYCYEKQLLADPKLAGTVTVHFTIDANGKVTSSTGTGLAKVDGCVATVIKDLMFDKPTTGKTEVNYPFAFRPAGSDPKIAAGTDDKAMIRSFIRANQAKLQYCYERELLAKPDLAGTVTVKFTIEADGKVSAATASGLAKVDACVAQVIREIAFDKPKDGKTEINYPFTFKPGA
jgi:TonB family protein